MTEEVGVRPGSDSRAKLTTLAVWVLLLGTLTWRVRTAAELESTPLDSAGFIRVACDGFAAVLALVSVQGRRFRGRPTLAIVLYVAYTVSAVFGLAAAVSPSIVGFRVAEILVYVVVFLACVANYTDGTAAILQIVRFSWVLVLTIIVGVLVAPSAALAPTTGGLFPFRLEGVLPALSANTVGALGVIFFASGIGMRRVRFSWVGVGLALVVLSQYRTGYVAVVLIVGVWLLVRRGIASKAVIVGLSVLVLAALQSPAIQEAWYRTSPGADSVSNLSGRTDYWSLALDVAGRSPFVGTGLSSGTRYEVLAVLGHDETSTVHGAWIEAYVGTGVIGTSFLLLSVLAALVHAFRAAPLTVMPLTILTGLITRSFTGSVFELPSVSLLLFLVAAGFISWGSLKDAVAGPQASVLDQGIPTAGNTRTLRASR